MNVVVLLRRSDPTCNSALAMFTFVRSANVFLSVSPPPFPAPAAFATSAPLKPFSVSALSDGPVGSGENDDDEEVEERWLS